MYSGEWQEFCDNVKIETTREIANMTGIEKAIRQVSALLDEHGNFTISII